MTEGVTARITQLSRAFSPPLGETNRFGYLIYGAGEAPVRHAIARVRVLLRDFRHTTLDPEALAREAKSVSPALWERFRGLG